MFIHFCARVQNAHFFFEQWNARVLAKRCINIWCLCLVCTVYSISLACSILSEWSNEAQLLYLHPNTTTKLCDCILFAILESFSRLCALYFVAWVCIVYVCVCVCVLMQQIPISKLVFDSSLLLVFLLCPVFFCFK